MTRALIVLMILVFGSSTALACRTSGPPGPDDCASQALQQERAFRQEDLRRIEAQRQWEAQKHILEIERIKRQQELDALKQQRPR